MTCDSSVFALPLCCMECRLTLLILRLVSNRSVSCILSVSVLAWPFVVEKIRKVCPAEFN